MKIDAVVQKLLEVDTEKGWLIKKSYANLINTTIDPFEYFTNGMICSLTSKSKENLAQTIAILLTAFCLYTNSIQAYANPCLNVASANL